MTQPWKANVLFRPLSPDAFTTFNEPGFVKIAWTLRADATGATGIGLPNRDSAVATDVMARTRFRRYWSLLSPGIIVIRRMMLQPLKAEAERRAEGDERQTQSVLLQSRPRACRDEARWPADGCRRLQP